VIQISFKHLPRVLGSARRLKKPRRNGAQKDYAMEAARFLKSKNPHSSLLQMLSPALPTFTSTLDGWTPPDRRVVGAHPADRTDRADGWMYGTSGRMKPPLQRTEHRTCG